MFKRIQATNMFSWETLDFEVKPGISQIVGFNHDDFTSEGSGKSSISNILSWVLYGNTPKDIKIDEVIRQGEKSCEGTVTLEDGTQIIRKRKPNDLFVVRDGEVLKGKDAKETQEMITKIIGLDFEAFCQSVYFAQNNPKRFITSSETEKVNIISDIQDLSVFDRARKRAQDSLKKNDTVLNTLAQDRVRLEGDVRKFESNIDLLVSFIKRFDEGKVVNLDTKNKAITRVKAQIKELKEKVKPDTLELIKQEIAQLDQMMENLTNNKSGLTQTLRDSDRTKARYEQLVKLCERTVKTQNALSTEWAAIETKLVRFNNSGATCPTCDSIVELHQLKHLVKEKSELVAKQEAISEQAEELSSEYEANVKELQEMGEISDTATLSRMIDEITVEQNALKVKHKKLAVEHETVIRAESQLEQLTKELERYKKEFAQIEDSEPISQMEQLEKAGNDKTIVLEALEIVNTKIQEAKLRGSHLEILKSGFKEVKQYIFQSLLTELSSKATALTLELFEVPVSIAFNNQDSEGGVSKILTTITIDGVGRSLGLLSGGQQRRVELAVDLALAAIVANRNFTPINFRIFDEPFANLSEVSMEKAVKLLEKLPGSTLIVEHNSIIQSIINNTFEIEYRNGVSKHAA